MAPGVVHIEGDSGRQLTLKANSQSVVARGASRKILRDLPEGCVWWHTRQTRKASGASGGRAISVQSFIAYRDVNAMHTDIIDA